MKSNNIFLSASFFENKIKLNNKSKLIYFKLQKYFYIYKKIKFFISSKGKTKIVNISRYLIPVFRNK